MGGAQLAHRHVFGFKSGVKGNMHFTDDAHLLQHGNKNQPAIELMLWNVVGTCFVSLCTRISPVASCEDIIYIYIHIFNIIFLMRAS